MKPLHIIALILVAGAMVSLVVFSGEYTTFETFEKAYETPGKSYQVVGTLVPDKPLIYNPKKDPNRFAFYMQDEDGVERKVVYGDAKPQDFERSEQIVLTGYATDSVFVASEILMKCPSKYVEDEVRVTTASVNE